MNTRFARFIRTAAIVLMGLTAVVTLLGGIGTTCAALTPEKWASMMPLAPYKWLYQLLVVTTLAAGIGGVWATVTLVRGRRGSYRDALIFLAAGILLAAVQMAASRA